MMDNCEELCRREAVRIEVDRLRGASDRRLAEYDADSARRRTEWFRSCREQFSFLQAEDVLLAGYHLLLARFRITPDQAPVLHRNEHTLVFHSRNFCPTLEACRQLGLDTRTICRKLNENATDALLKQLDPRLSFARNYEKLRPYTAYCEEMILLNDSI